MDQLLKAMSTNNPCRNYPFYEEPVINFLPTYKRERTNNNYVNKKNQAPSYTDRILLRNNTCQKHSINKYITLDNVFGSDHRPVVLEFDIKLKQPSYMEEISLLDSNQAHEQLFSIFTFDNLTCTL